MSLIELAPHVMPILSDELATVLERTMRDHGIDLHSGSGFESIAVEADHLKVSHSRGSPIECELVILAIGVSPNSELARACGLALGMRGSIAVDRQMRTSDPSIFAVGDVVQVTSRITEQPTTLPLAGPANREGRVVADVLSGLQSEFAGVQGTSVCRMFELTVGMTGETAATLARSKALDASEVECVHVHAPSHAGYYPGAQPIHLDLTFHRASGRVLGAQAVGVEGVDKRIDVLAAFIQMRATVSDVAQAELCYAPPVGARRGAEA